MNANSNLRSHCRIVACFSPVGVRFHGVADALVRLLRSRAVATSLGVGEQSEGAAPDADAIGDDRAESLLRWCEMGYIVSYCFILWCVWFSADRQLMALEWQLAVTARKNVHRTHQTLIPAAFHSYGTGISRSRS